MAKEIDLIVESRETSGTSNARRMRHAGMVPAVIYGAAKETLNLAIDHNQLLRKLANESFLNSILTIKIGNQEEAVLIKDIQIHPSKKQVMHLDLQRVKSDVVIRVSIPLQFINEDQSDGVKLEGGTVTALMNEVEVSCLPKDLPEKLEVDVSNLKLDDMLYLEDIELPEGVELPQLTQDEPANDPIVAIRLLRIQEEIEETIDDVEGEEGEEGEDSGEATTEGAASDGDTKDNKEEG